MCEISKWMGQQKYYKQMKFEINIVFSLISYEATNP